jgi:hypothetical protein
MTGIPQGANCNLRRYRGRARVESSGKFGIDGERILMGMGFPETARWS